MAMMNTGAPLGLFGCPSGECRAQAQAPARTSWKSLAASFAAGALAVSAVAILSASSFATAAARPDAAHAAAAARWAAFVGAQTPRELPREWRQEIKVVDLDGMIRTPR